MFFQLATTILIGITFGIVTGLTPGVHINLVSVLIVSFSPLLMEYFSPLSLTVLIIAMGVTHTFLDNIPSIFLGAPDVDEALSVLPGHRMLLQGEGYRGVMLMTFGSVCSLALVSILSPIIIFFTHIGYPIIKEIMGYLLVIITLLFILKECGSRLWAISFFMLSGCLGLIVLNMPNLNEPLFPLLSGLFGISSLIISLNSQSPLPEQRVTKLYVEKKLGLKALGGALSSGSVCSFLPGLGPSHAAIIASQFLKKLGNEGFLILVGGLGTVNMVASFITSYSIGKARSGAVAAILKIINPIDINTFLIFIGTSLTTGGISVFLSSMFAKKFSIIINKINYKKLCLVIILFVAVLVFSFSGVLGLFVLVVSTFIGLLPAVKGTARNHLMGCLLLPVILYFL